MPHLRRGMRVAIMLFMMTCTRQKSVGPSSIPWITQMDSALALAGRENKLIMADFKAEWCPPCRMMEDSTFSNPAVIEKAGAFVPVRIDVDNQGKIADHYNANAGKYGGVGIPNILFMDHHENVLAHPIGYQSADRLIVIMDSVLCALRKQP